MPSSPAPGWYADPWAPARQRYWDGDRWTADVFSPGWEDSPVDPTQVAALGAPPTVRAEPPPPAPSWQLGSEPEVPAAPPPPASHSDRSLIVGGVVAVLLAAVLVVLLMGQLDRRRGDEPAAAPATPVPQRSESPPPTQSAPPPGESPSPAPQYPQPTVKETLADLVVRQQDVPARFRVSPIPGGRSVAGGPTLDLCDGRFPSEALRVGRLQTEAVDPAGDRTLSTEAVQYEDPVATAQAFQEVEKVAAECQGQVTLDLGTGQMISRSVSAADDSGWGSTAGVDRLAYRATEQAGADRSTTLVVYLKRGPLFLGLYFPRPTGPQMPVEGRRTVPAIVKLFEERLLGASAGTTGGSGGAGGSGAGSPGDGVGA